jgi:3-hydroxybutyryl-CoA dehydrogenase
VIPITSVAVVGAGTMGSGIAQVFAQAGCRVVLCDESAAALTRAGQTIDRSLAKVVDTGAVTNADRAATLARLELTSSLETVATAGHVIEAIAEDADAKRAIFAALDRITAPDVILASNTSSIPISTLGEATTRADRVVGMHFMNPVPLMPLVEVVRGRATSEATMATTLGLCNRLGKTAVESKDSPGFIANRILMPMINEAICALHDQVGTAEAIDTVMRLGMRHPMGPLALADLIGLDVCLAILDVLRTGLCDEKFRACPLLREKVGAGQLGRKTGAGFYRYEP